MVMILNPPQSHHLQSRTKTAPKSGLNSLPISLVVKGNHGPFAEDRILTMDVIQG